MTRTALITLTVFCTLLLAGVMIAQPSLAPPAGPIDESGRFGRLIELNQTNTPGNANALFVIDEPGSYVLGADADAGTRDGIHIAADNVTIDLNGYTLTGTPGADTRGVVSVLPENDNFSFANATVRNGAIDGFDSGVRMDNFFFGDFFFVSSVRGARIEHLDITNTLFGIRITSSGIVDRCTISTTRRGIDGGNVILNCLVLVEGDDPSALSGIITSGSSVTGCTVLLSPTVGQGVAGYILNGSTVSNSTARGGGIGFILNNRSVATGCVADNSTADAQLNEGSQSFSSNF